MSVLERYLSATMERLRIFAVRLFTGMDRNGPNNRNGLPELFCFCFVLILV